MNYIKNNLVIGLIGGVAGGVCLLLGPVFTKSTSSYLGVPTSWTLTVAFILLLMTAFILVIAHTPTRGKNGKA